MGKRIAGAVLVLCMLVGLLAACSGGGGGGGGGDTTPKTATIKVTVKDQDDQLLANVGVSVGSKSATTNAQGLATLIDVTPGSVTVKLSGDGYQAAEHTATVAAGDNDLSYKLEPPPMAARDVGEVTSMRLRMVGESAGVEHGVEAELAANGDSKWVYEGMEVIATQNVLYIRPDGEPWTRFDGELGRAMSEAYLGASRVYVNEFRTFSTDLADGIYSGRLVGQEEANGYPCRVYEISWEGLGHDFNYKVWVISSGSEAGYMTRYRWEQTGIGWMTIDLYDLGADIQIEAPM